MVDGLVNMALGLGLPADATHGGVFLDNIEGWYLPARVMELIFFLAAIIGTRRFRYSQWR